MPERLQLRIKEMKNNIKWVSVLGLFDMIFEIYPPY
jgi:hypothetical protein